MPISQPMLFRCPNASLRDPFHVLTLVNSAEPVRRVSNSTNPFVAYQPFFAWDSHAEQLGLDGTQRSALVRETDAKIASIAGTGFHVTPLQRSDALSEALGFSAAGGVWIKDETGQVAGSHKSRHLMGCLLALLTLEKVGEAPWGIDPTCRPPLAIASCGNAAIAAATLAAAVSWPIRVFVPDAANPEVLRQLRALDAHVVACPRRAADPPGDPCVLRYRESVRDGAIPFSVQGPENAWCLDGGRSIGWELGALEFDRVFVQVGGGALASCLIEGMLQIGSPASLHVVQTEGCAPFDRAWDRARSGQGGIATAPKRWPQCMTAWDAEPHSLADGILDDETYDWLGVVAGLVTTGGSSVVASEPDVVQANALCGAHTAINASFTGTAGLAGLLAIRDAVGHSERVAVVFSGIRR